MTALKLVQLGSAGRAPLLRHALSKAARMALVYSSSSPISAVPRSATSAHLRHATTKAASSASESSSKSPSATAAPISGVPRHHQAKVEVLPFRISSKSAREYLTTLAKTEVMPRVMTQWDIIKHQVRSLNPFRGFEADEQIVKLERMTALYLPTWIVDASFEAKCRGNDGKAEANFITVSSRFPGHSWKPMDSLPLFPPPPYDMKPNQTNSGDPSLDPSANREAWETLAMVDYESYESYLKTKGNSKVQIQGGLPEPLPFTISPLFLPDMIRDQLESADATFIAELAAGFELPGGDKHGLGLTMSLVDEDGKPIISPPVRFEPGSLKIDMMAAYPIMMPLHMAEFSYVEAEDGETRHLTFVMGGWDTSGLLFCMKEKGEDWKQPGQGAGPLLLHTLDLYPRPPIKTQLNEWYEREREQEKSTQRRDWWAESKLDPSDPFTRPNLTRKEVEAEIDRYRAQSNKHLQSDLQSRLKEKLKTELPIAAEIEKRSAELLERADWIHWERDEREAFQVRTARSDPAHTMITKAQKERYAAAVASARKAPTDPRPLRWLSQRDEREAELEHPDRKAGLGRYIFWSSPHVQRLSHNVYANRRYLREAIPEVLRSRKQMASLAEGGYNVDTSLVKVNLQDGRKLSGDEAYQTVAANDLSMRQQREALKPRWLKALQNSFIRR
ncbi:hypothetical protein PaG_04740 [Moesziomyces aphidis]|uniref:Uncharacterized protein n=1 Tax=Moesziomyces aphidis TaxID=84754 RepID=W3VJ53_MOEAP|nr:hypothetical protein PaG_04740 [Moesziomyces aphidis]